MPHQELRASESVLVASPQLRPREAGLSADGLPLSGGVGPRSSWFGCLQVGPVVERELRESARRPANRRLRLASALVGTLLLWFLVASHEGPVAELGPRLLGGIHTLLLVLILLIVAPLAADCIAREKREGTLGLLFLTPLTSGGIIMGKALVQGLRDLTLWLAVLPLLSIAFLAGGVTWFDTLSALSLEFCAALLCLAVGLFVSSVVQERHQAIPLACCLGAGSLFLFSQLVQCVLLVAWDGWAALHHAFSLKLTFGLLTGIAEGGSISVWHKLGRTSPILARAWLWICVASPLLVMLVFFATLRFAAARLSASWRDLAPSPARERRVRQYCSTLFRRAFPSLMRHPTVKELNADPLLRRRLRVHPRRCRGPNPVAWLQQYSGKVWLNKWVLCLGSLLLGFIFMAGSRPSRAPVHLGLLLLLLGGYYLFVAVNGFVEEKRSGALELLLVTPLSPNQIILGRARRLWQQFLPAGFIIAALYALSRWTEGMDREEVQVAAQWGLVLACAFVTLPIFATYFALRVKSLLGAAGLTLAVTWLPTQFTWEALEMFTDQPGLLFPPALLFANAGCALLAFVMLRHSLARRIYPL